MPNARADIRGLLTEILKLRRDDMHYRDEAGRAFLTELEDVLTATLEHVDNGMFALSTAQSMADGCRLALEEDRASRLILESFESPMFRGKVLLQMLRLATARKTYGMHRLARFPKKGPETCASGDGDERLKAAADWLRLTHDANALRRAEANMPKGDA